MNSNIKKYIEKISKESKVNNQAINYEITLLGAKLLEQSIYKKNNTINKEDLLKILKLIIIENINTIKLSSTLELFDMCFYKQDFSSDNNLEELFFDLITKTEYRLEIISSIFKKICVSNLELESYLSEELK